VLETGVDAALALPAPPTTPTGVPARATP